MILALLLSSLRLVVVVKMTDKYTDRFWPFSYNNKEALEMYVNFLHRVPCPSHPP